MLVSAKSKAKPGPTCKSKSISQKGKCKAAPLKGKTKPVAPTGKRKEVFQVIAKSPAKNGNLVAKSPPKGKRKEKPEGERIVKASSGAKRNSSTTSSKMQPSKKKLAKMDAVAAKTTTSNKLSSKYPFEQELDLIQTSTHRYLKLINECF